MKTVLQGLGGVETVIALEDGALVTGTVQDCTPILERAKAMHNEGLTGTADMRLAATVPMVVIEDYCNKNGVSYQEFMKSDEHRRRLLNDPANSLFRVWAGRV